MTRRFGPQERLAKLDAVLSGAKTMLIVVQNNPDPDAIATAAALREIANQRHGVACSVAHGGTIGRAENRALVRYLGLNTRPIDGVASERFDRLAVVDAQPGAGNVGLAGHAAPDIVIDHHPIRRETRSARFTDVRSGYGATATILYQYLRTAGIDVEPPLATALVYAIRSDTQDLGRESTRADLDAYLDLYPRANPRALSRILAAPLPHSYFSKLRRALDNATVFDHRVVSFLATLDSQDMIAEVADLLLRVEGASWSMCLGVVDGWLHASLRTTDRDLNAGAVARRAAGRTGFGGGHLMLAAVQIPLAQGEAGDPRRLQRVVARVVRRFLAATGSAAGCGQPLCTD